MCVDLQVQADKVQSECGHGGAYTWYCASAGHYIEGDGSVRSKE